MNVDYTVRASTQTCINERVVVGKLGLVEHTSHLVVREILPADRETEQAVAVVLDKVLHLTEAIGTYTCALNNEPRCMTQKNHLTAELCEGWTSVSGATSTICAASEICGDH